MPCIGKLFESVLNNRRSFKNNAKIMTHFKPVLEVTPGQVIIYLYYVSL